MKPVQAWAVTLPRKLHSITGNMPSISAPSRWMYPIYRSLYEARAAARQWSFSREQPRIIRVEIREVPYNARNGPDSDGYGWDQVPDNSEQDGFFCGAWAGKEGA